MAQPAATPSPSATSFVSSTPTASLRSSATAKRVSIVSLHPDLDQGDSHPSDRSSDRRIEKWLQQQSDGFLEHEKGRRAEMQSTEDAVEPLLRHAQSSRTLLTTCSATTPVTNASFSWESDRLLSASPSTPSSSPAVPFAPVLSYSGSSPPFHSKSQPMTYAHPETEAARADSPLLPVNELTAPTTLLDTINEGKEINPLDRADTDKPLPLPPLPSPRDLTAGIPDTSTTGPAPERPRRGSSTNLRRTPNHSPTSSYSSSTSSRQSHPHYSQSNGHSSVCQLPIGVAHPPLNVQCHDRTPSGSFSNGRVSRSPSFASSVQPAVTLSMATPAPTRRETHKEMREEKVIRSILPLSASTRARSHSNAIPSSTKQFHLPTGMIHRSQSHAQLRNGVPVPLTGSPPSNDLQTSKGPSHPPVALFSLALSGAGGAPRLLARRPSKHVVSPSISRTPSYTSTSIASRELLEEVGDPTRSRPGQISQCHTRQTSEILDRLESRVPSLSSSFSRNAIYLDSEDISARLDELLLLAKEEMENRVVEEDEESVGTVEAGEEGKAGEQWIDMVKGHGRGESINQQPIASPPNTPATGYFGSVLSIAGSQAVSATGRGAGFYASPEAGSSQVYLGSNPISQKQSIEQLSGKHLNIARNVEVEEHLPLFRPQPTPLLEAIDPDTTNGECRLVDSVPQHEAIPVADIPISLPMHTPTPPEQMEEDEMMEDALALARELAVEDRMVWDVRRSLEVFDDCWSEFEDEEMGVGVCTTRVPRNSVVPGPYSFTAEGDPGVANDHVRFVLCGGDGHGIRNGGLAPPSASKWSLTSSIDEEKRTSLDGKPKKEKKRRSFVPFMISGDRDKEPKDDKSNNKENGTIGKKRNRLASFISRLSSVGIGGSGSNTPSLHTPPIPTLSASNSSHALPVFFSTSTVSSKWDSPSLPALTPNFSATASRSSSPTALADPPQFQHPQVTIVADDDCSNSSPSSSRLVLASFSSMYDSVTPSPASRPPTPPSHNIPLVTRRPIPPGIVIPPLPTRPPPELPSVAPPLGKAASEGMINANSPPSMSRPRANSAADLLAKHVTFTSALHTPSSSPRIEQTSMMPPPTLRPSILAKSASASVLGLHQQLGSFASIVLADGAAGGYYDDGLVPPTPGSIISTEEYGEIRRREDFYDDGGLHAKRPRLRAMSSLGSLPLSGTVNPGPPRTKGGIKGFVGRLTGRGRNNIAKTSPVQIHIPPSFLAHDNSNHQSIYDPDLATPIAIETPSPKHSPSASLSVSAGGGNPTATGGVLSGFRSYLERTSFRQA